MYFRPAPNEVGEIIKDLGIEKEDTAMIRRILLNLERGEALAVGKLEIGLLKMEKPVKINFYGKN